MYLAEWKRSPGIERELPADTYSLSEILLFGALIPHRGLATAPPLDDAVLAEADRRDDEEGDEHEENVVHYVVFDEALQPLEHRRLLKAVVAILVIPKVVEGKDRRVVLRVIVVANIGVAIQDIAHRTIERIISFVFDGRLHHRSLVLAGREGEAAHQVDAGHALSRRAVLRVCRGQPDRAKQIV